MPFKYKYQKDPMSGESDIVVKTITDKDGKYIREFGFIVKDPKTTNTDYLEWKEWDAQSGNTTEAAD